MSRHLRIAAAAAVFLLFLLSLRLSLSLVSLFHGKSPGLVLTLQFGVHFSSLPSLCRAVELKKEGTLMQFVLKA